MILGRTREDKVWRLNKSTYLNMDCAVLEKVLEAATEASTAEVEGLIVEGLEVKKSSLPSSDASFPTPNILLARVVARIKRLFQKTIEIFQRYLQELHWNVDLVHLYQKFCFAIFYQVANPIVLFPDTLQSLASLLLTHKSMSEFGVGGRARVVEVVRNNFDLNSCDVKMVLLQFPGILLGLSKFHLTNSITFTFDRLN